MAFIVGIGGIKGSGKDYFGKILIRSLQVKGLTVEVRKFADPIKQSLESFLGQMTEEQYDEFKRVNHPMSFGNEARLIPGREIVRGHGMKMRSYDGGQQFLDYVNGPSDAHVIVVTDLRFENEFRGVDWFAKVEVHNPEVVSDGHESEKKWPAYMYDYTVMNDGGHHGASNMAILADELARKVTDAVLVDIRGAHED